MLLSHQAPPNNPALLALTDALGPMSQSLDDIRLLTVGTGSFPVKSNAFTRRSAVETFITLLGTNAKTVDGLRELLYPALQAARIDEAFAAERYQTNFLESDTVLLESIFQLGRGSFGKNESAILGLFG